MLLQKERKGETTGNHPDWSLSSRQIPILPVCPVQNAWSSGVKTSAGFLLYDPSVFLVDHVLRGLNQHIECRKTFTPNQNDDHKNTTKTRTGHKQTHDYKQTYTTPKDIPAHQRPTSCISLFIRGQFISASVIWLAPSFPATAHIVIMIARRP